MKSTGSASVSGSATTRPAGTSTSQRRERLCNARARNSADGHADHQRHEPEHDLAVGQEERASRDTRDHEGARQRQRPRVQARWRPQRETLFVAVGDRVGGRERERAAGDEHGREHRRHDGPGGGERVRVGPDRRRDREDGERGRDRADRGERRRAGGDDGEEAHRPRAPQQDLGDHLRRGRPRAEGVGRRRPRGDGQRHPHRHEEPPLHAASLAGPAGSSTPSAFGRSSAVQPDSRPNAARGSRRRTGWGCHRRPVDSSGDGRTGGPRRARRRAARADPGGRLPLLPARRPERRRRRVRRVDARAARARGGPPRARHARLADPGAPRRPVADVRAGHAREPDVLPRQRLRPRRARGVVRAADPHRRRPDRLRRGAEARRSRDLAALRRRPAHPRRDPGRRDHR